jgi:hypothetical protein
MKMCLKDGKQGLLGGSTFAGKNDLVLLRDGMGTSCFLKDGKMRPRHVLGGGEEDVEGWRGDTWLPNGWKDEVQGHNSENTRDLTAGEGFEFCNGRGKTSGSLARTGGCMEKDDNVPKGRKMRFVRCDVGMQRMMKVGLEDGSADAFEGLRLPHSDGKGGFQKHY